jgi:hypothetical protein
MIIENTHHNYCKDKVVPAHAFNIYKGRETEVQIHSFLNSGNKLMRKSVHLVGLPHKYVPLSSTEHGYVTNELLPVQK